MNSERRWHNAELEQSLLACDLEVMQAHVQMLAATNIVDKAAAQVVLDGLAEIAKQVKAGQNYLSEDDIDIHVALERRLKELVGDTAHIVRIAISRNDQIATDVRLWLRRASHLVAEQLLAIRRQLVELAERDLDVVMPGYTHMQPAQPILISHWWLANEARFARDFERLWQIYPRLNQLPLGACVLAGTKEPIDRGMVADLLGFDSLIENSLDAVSDRDFIVEFTAFASMVSMHLSQMASDLLLWATQEFGFIKLQKRFVFKAQRLPFKRNPELLEILRSRSASIPAHLVEFLMQLRTLPCGYSQDLQESLPGVLDVVQNLTFLLDLAATLLGGIDLDANRMREVACADLLNLTNTVQYLVDRGIDEQHAQRVSDQLQQYCKTRNKFLSDLALSEWQQFSPAFESDIYEHVTMEESVGAFCSFGGSSRDQVELAIQRSKQSLEQASASLVQKDSKSEMREAGTKA